MNLSEQANSGGSSGGKRREARVQGVRQDSPQCFQRETCGVINACCDVPQHEEAGCCAVLQCCSVITCPIRTVTKCWLCIKQLSSHGRKGGGERGVKGKIPGLNMKNIKQKHTEPPHGTGIGRGGLKRTSVCGDASLAPPDAKHHGTSDHDSRTCRGKEGPHFNPLSEVATPDTQGSSYQPSQGITHPSKWNSTERTGAGRRQCNLL